MDAEKKDEALAETGHDVTGKETQTPEHSPADTNENAVDKETETAEHIPTDTKENVVDNETETPAHTTADTVRTTEATTQKEVDSQGKPPSSDSSQAGVEGKTDEEKGAEQKGGEDGQAPRSKGKIALIMMALCMAVFLAALDVTIITTALPTISENFHSTAGYTWIGSAFLLANSASIPSWGKISDIFGRKPMLLFANIVFMVGSLVAALSNSIGMLIAARAVQGIGGGGLIILVNIVIGDLFSLRNRGAFYGVIGGVWAIASSIGPIIGGAFTQSVSWRWCFYINLPLDGLAFFILLFFLDVKTPRTPIMDGFKAIDWVGSATIVGGTLMFLFGLQYGGVTAPWDSALVICLLVFGVVTWVLFLIWEWKFAIYPIMPMGIFSSVSKVATLGVVFFHGFVFISGAYYLPLYFQAIRGATPIQSGVDLLPTAVSLAISSIGTGIFIKKSGMFLPPIYFGMFMMTLGYGLFIDFDATSSWTKIIIFQIIAGLGTGPLFQAPIIALQAHINPRDIGTATATLGFIRQLATSTSVVIGEVVFQNEMKKKAGALVRVLGPKLAIQLGGANAGANTRIIDALPDNEKGVVRTAFADSLQPMWILYTAFAGVGFLTVFLIRKKVLSAQHEETKTGLEAEKENAAQRTAEREAKRESKRQSQLLSHSRGNSRPQSQNMNRTHIEPVEEGVEKERPRTRDLEQGIEEGDESKE
jgi:EmrB/QacA subfamily drug resistance transporter